MHKMQKTKVKRNLLKSFGVSLKNVVFSTSLAVAPPCHVDLEHVGQKGLRDVDREGSI